VIRSTSIENRWTKAVASAVGAVAISAIGTGCETKSFLDPSELGRIEKTPLVVPILDKLVVGVEGEEMQFANARDVTPADLEVAAVDYKVGPNDTLQITIQDLVGAGLQSIENKRVSETGRISLPYLKPLTVAGLTETDVEELVIKAYADENILPKAIVSVSVLDAQNRVFSVTGSVGQPGPYGLPRSDYRLLDALTAARGASSEVGIDYVYIIRKLDSASPATPDAPATPAGDPLLPQGLNRDSSKAIYALKLEDPAPGSVEEARKKAMEALEEAQKASAEAAKAAPAVEVPAVEVPAVEVPAVDVPVVETPVAPDPLMPDAATSDHRNAYPGRRHADRACRRRRLRIPRPHAGDRSRSHSRSA
jgi:protein involved in polysaccharide export with SLBB domain